MSKQIKTIIAVGGTGGHVFPGLNLAEHLKEKNFGVKLVTDKRGYVFFENYKSFNVTVIPSSPLINKSIISIGFSTALILISVLRSLIFLIFNRPKIIFGMGGYASFPICIAAKILNIKFIIYENNLIIGKANKYLLPFAEKIFVSYKELEGIPSKFNFKIFEIGNIIKKSIIHSAQIKEKNKITDDKNINILILGGSQAAKIFAEVLPEIFKDCLAEGISLKIFQHCLPQQEKKLSSFYNAAGIEFETFNFSKNLIEYFKKVDLAITRSGASMLSELTNFEIPFISIPLPSSAEKHQLKNAIYYKKKKFGFLIEEKDLKSKLFPLIKDIYFNKSLLDDIKNNQKQYSDKNVYNNIDQTLKKIIDEKN